MRGDLQRKLARRGEDERTNGTAGLRAGDGTRVCVGEEVVEDGQAVGERFAGALRVYT